VAHLTVTFYLLALLAGAAGLSQTVLIWQRYRKAVIRLFGLFQVSLSLVLLSFLVDLYARVASLAPSGTVADIVWILQAGGSLLYIIVAPPFYDSLLGLARRRWKRILFFGLDAAVVGAAAADVAVPSLTGIRIGLSGVLFAMIAYGLVLIAVRLSTVADRTLKRALAVFLVLSACFFPLMYIDMAMSFVPVLAAFGFLNNLTLPAYFLLLNCLGIVFGLRYLNRPAYSGRDGLTDYFLSTFRITDREKQIISLLFDGAGTKRIADMLFISEKTVENHVYNIYQKLRVRNRVQMFQLIQSNALD
jgi:DNA-binding CsgD family transcriptional regulator